MDLLQIDGYTLTSKKLPKEHKLVMAFMNETIQIKLIYGKYDMKDAEPKWRLPDYTSLDVEYPNARVTHWKYE